MPDTVPQLEIDGAIAGISLRAPQRHNALSILASFRSADVLESLRAMSGKPEPAFTGQ